MPAPRRGPRRPHPRGRRADPLAVGHLLAVQFATRRNGRPNRARRARSRADRCPSPRDAGVLDACPADHARWHGARRGRVARNAERGGAGEIDRRSPCARASSAARRAYVGKSMTPSVSTTAATASAAILSRTGKRDAAAREMGVERGEVVREEDARRGAEVTRCDCFARSRHIRCRSGSLRAGYFSASLDGGVMAQGGGGLMVSVSGIRGRVGEALTPEVVARYAAAFGAWSLAQGGSRADRRRARQPRLGPDVPPHRRRPLQIGRLRRHRHRADDDARLPARRRASSRRGRP